MELPRQFLQQFLNLEQVPVHPKLLGLSYPKESTPVKISVNEDPKEQVQIKEEPLGAVSDGTGTPRAGSSGSGTPRRDLLGS